MGDDRVDDAPALSSHALGALKDFYSERDARKQQFEDLKANVELEGPNRSLSMDAFAEDWNASQFWYDEETATRFARQLLAGSTNDTHIAIISAPSVFVQLKKISASYDSSQALPRIHLFEFDERFSVFPEFVKYDYENPVRLPSHLKGLYDHIICDPPFLSTDCQTKAALTVRWLAKTWSPSSYKLESTAPEVSALEEDNSRSIAPIRLIVCTGERMSELVLRLYRSIGLQMTGFEPRHANGLSNEFKCYANFECDDWKWR